MLAWGLPALKEPLCVMADFVVFTSSIVTFHHSRWGPREWEEGSGKEAGKGDGEGKGIQDRERGGIEKRG